MVVLSTTGQELSVLSARPWEFSDRRNAAQNARSSDFPISKPSTSRHPSAATAAVMTTAWETTR